MKVPEIQVVDQTKVAVNEVIKEVERIVEKVIVVDNVVEKVVEVPQIIEKIVEKTV